MAVRGTSTCTTPTAVPPTSVTPRPSDPGLTVASKGPGDGALLFCGARPDNARMPNSRDDARRAAWSAYWATGGLHAGGGSLAVAYARTLRGFSRGQVAHSPAT